MSPTSYQAAPPRAAAAATRWRGVFLAESGAESGSRLTLAEEAIVIADREQGKLQYLTTLKLKGDMPLIPLGSVGKLFDTEPFRPIEAPRDMTLLAGDVRLFTGKFGVSRGRNAIKIHASVRRPAGRR